MADFVPFPKIPRLKRGCVITDAPKLPRVLDAIADKVLAYKPKPKSEAAKKRKKTKRKLEKAGA